MPLITYNNNKRAFCALPLTIQFDPFEFLKIRVATNVTHFPHPHAVNMHQQSCVNSDQGHRYNSTHLALVTVSTSTLSQILNSPSSYLTTPKTFAQVKSVQLLAPARMRIYQTFKPTIISGYFFQNDKFYFFQIDFYLFHLFCQQLELFLWEVQIFLSLKIFLQIDRPNSERL